MGSRRHHAVLLLVVAAAITACASLPPSAERGNDGGAAIAHAAAQLIGTPYRFGGDGGEGFDCSGLVAYVHERAGLDVPRTADAQRRAAHPVQPDALLPGDVVFFRTHAHIGRHRVDHVGIYAGDGRFIHAPHSGGMVSYASLTTGYYQKHFVSAGRFWDARQP
jgi:cell wall-associated NlpC family hydrolase